MSFYVIVVVKNEVVKFLNALLQIVQRYVTIFVEVKSQPLILNDDRHIFVVSSNV